MKGRTPKKADSPLMPRVEAFIPEEIKNEFSRICQRDGESQSSVLRGLIRDFVKERRASGYGGRKN